MTSDAANDDHLTDDGVRGTHLPIKRGDYPEWELGLQLFDDDFADRFDFDVLDSQALAAPARRQRLRGKRMTSTDMDVM
jgi:catalase